MLKVISVQDSIASAFLQPAYARTTAEAIRIFESHCRDPKSQFALHPSDYSLYEIGTFDEISGEIKPTTPIVFISRATEFVTTQTQLTQQ